MHSQLRDLLRDASGESRFVLAVNIDIRGFSSFFADSSQAAAFLSYAYTRILDEYFPDVSFFKPTGDGLLLVKEVDRASIPAALSGAVAAGLRLDGEFVSICDEDTLINFPTPPHVGIGLSRGTATRLSGEGKTLDFSGMPLNLASRLMDLARPHGVVFDAGLVSGLDVDEYSNFTVTPVYVKGIAEADPVRVYHSPAVAIPQANREPIGVDIRREPGEKLNYSKIAQRAPMFIHQLSVEPVDHKRVEIHYMYPAADSNGRKTQLSHQARLAASEVRRATNGRWEAIFDYSEIKRVLDEYKVKKTWEIGLRVTYPVRAGHGGEPKP